MRIATLRSVGFAAISVVALAALPQAASRPAPALANSRVIVRAQHGHLTAATEAVLRAGGHPVRTIGLIDAVVADLTSDGAARVAADPDVAAVSVDASLHLLGSSYDPAVDPNSMAQTATQTGATAFWQAGLDGRGVDVALIDSGVARVEGLNDNGQLLDGPDLSFDSQQASTIHVDTFGHGTFMAGLIAGRDPATAHGSIPYRGIAPGARLVSIKVADGQGATDVSQMLAAIDWVVQHRNSDGLHIRVLNLSYGTDSTQDYDLDPLAYAAEQAWRKGIVVVAAAGNRGNQSGRLDDPAIDPFVVAVGASSRGDDGSLAVAAFSSRGDGARNPDLIAPGTHLQGLRAPGSTLDRRYGSTAALGTRFFRGSGTSEATALTSGAAALVLQQHPRATPDQVKALLTGTARSLDDADARLQGNGALDLRSARDSDVDDVVQSFTPAQGAGSLEQSRGSAHISLSGHQLRGETDIFGRSVDTRSLAADEDRVRSWAGAHRNGSVWTGVTWTGSAWNGVTWSGSTWTGVTWSSATCSGVTWSGSGFDGVTWSAASWD